MIYQRIRNGIKVILLVLPFLYTGFVIADHYGLWDKYSGLIWAERAEARFEKSYGFSASIRIRPGDEAWKPTVALIRRYSSATLQANREPKVIARMKADFSTRSPEIGPLISEWTAPSTPILLAYADVPITGSLNMEDAVVVGSLGDFKMWISKEKERRRYFILSVFLGIFGPLLGVFVFFLDRKIQNTQAPYRIY